MPAEAKSCSARQKIWRDFDRLAIEIRGRLQSLPYGFAYKGGGLEYRPLYREPKRTQRIHADWRGGPEVLP